MIWPRNNFDSADGSQFSHDLMAREPLTDLFDNALGTMILPDATRK